jgi:hypothetical protein
MSIAVCQSAGDIGATGLRYLVSAAPINESDSASVASCAEK